MKRTACQEFAVTPPDLRKAWLVPGLALMAAGAGMVFAAREEPRILLFLPVLLLSVVVIAVVTRRRRVGIEAGELRVHAGMHSRRVALGELDLVDARIVDLRERTEFRPALKLMATRLPGLSLGHFRLRDRSRAFVLLTDASRVLVLNERSGRRLLLSLHNPQALLDALRAAHSPDRAWERARSP
ncbi:MAG TPA: hypothetical protein VFR30_08320 [Lysobacter sp.]|nr:hypothetical protein [Lysobacter sp.]